MNIKTQRAWNIAIFRRFILPLFTTKPTLINNVITFACPDFYTGTFTIFNRFNDARIYDAQRKGFVRFAAAVRVGLKTVTIARTKGEKAKFHAVTIARACGNFSPRLCAIFSPIYTYYAQVKTSAIALLEAELFLSLLAVITQTAVEASIDVITRLYCLLITAKLKVSIAASTLNNFPWE